MKEDRKLVIHFEGLDDAAANQAAMALEEHLSAVTGGEIQTKRHKAREGTQDFGTIIISCGFPLLGRAYQESLE